MSLDIHDDRRWKPYKISWLSMKGLTNDEEIHEQYFDDMWAKSPESVDFRNDFDTWMLFINILMRNLQNNDAEKKIDCFKKQ